MRQAAVFPPADRMIEVWRLLAATFLTALITGAGMFFIFAGNSVSKADAAKTAEDLIARDRHVFDLTNEKLVVLIDRQNEIADRLSRLEGKIDALSEARDDG